MIFKKYFLVTPTEYTIGNASEDIYMASIYSLINNKTLIILVRRPTLLRFFFRNLKIKKITNSEIFKLTCNQPIILKSKWYLIFLSWALDFCFLALYFFNKSIFRIYNFGAKKFDFNKININYTPSINLSKIYKFTNRSLNFENLSSINWQNYLNIRIDYLITNENNGFDIIRQMGLNENDWFVCVHVRELGFHSNSSEEGSYRCADINNYESTFDYIASIGGYVIRLGDSSMKKIKSNSRIIDYANSRFKSDFMDLFLIKHCKYYFGMDSGIYDTAVLFQKSIIMANLTGWWFALPVKKNDIFIIKHIYSKSKCRMLSVKEVLDLPFDVCFHFYDDLTFTDSDYLFLENKEEDIFDLVKEKIEMDHNYKYDKLQNLFCEGRQVQILKWISEENIFKNNSNLAYRFAIRYYYQGSLSKKFLTKYWN